MRLIYIAQPLDHTKERDWGNNLSSAIRENNMDVACYRPGNSWDVRANGVDPRIEVVNRAALDACDALLAIIPSGVPTIGVPREIEAFASTGKPWGVITDLEKSFSLADAPIAFPLTPGGLLSAARWVGITPMRSPVPGRTSNVWFTKDSDYDGQLPTRAHSGDAGFDLYAAESVSIPYDQFRDVPCGVRVALPEGVWGRIVGRSSTIRKRDLLVTEGTIDTGYRGPLFAGVRNLGRAGTVVEKGDRIAQLILLPNASAQYRAAWTSAAHFADIPHDGRGDNGFGSSGR